MRTTVIVAALICLAGVMDGNTEKDQKRELESQAKALIAKAQTLERSGELSQARKLYVQSQSQIDLKQADKGIARIDGKVFKLASKELTEAGKLYRSGDFAGAASILERALKLEVSESVMGYDLALSYRQLGNRGKAIYYLDQVRDHTAGKRRVQLSELETQFSTGEQLLSLKGSDKDRVARFNQMLENIGAGATLGEELGDGEDPSGSQPAAQGTGSKRERTHNACQAIREISPAVASSPAGVFDLANCAEANGRYRETLQYLMRYVQLSPQAIDGEAVHVRMASLQCLVAFSGNNADEVRRLYAAAGRAIEERRYDRALEDFSHGAQLAPDFALMHWKLGLLYEAMGDIDKAREQFASYQQLAGTTEERQHAQFHLDTIGPKRDRYDDEVDEAADILSDLFNRAMNLTFNGPENRRAIRARRAIQDSSDKKAKKKVGGFAVPFTYAQDRLALAEGHLQTAAALCPLGAEVNELLGLVYLQANDGRSAMRSFDAVASQQLPVSFYAELRGHKQDRAVKCELSRDGVRLMFIGSYDSKGRATAPQMPAGEDGLGNIVLGPADARQAKFETLDLKAADIKQVETKDDQVVLRIAKENLTLSPVFLPVYTPTQGAQARRFGNHYTRLFARFAGLESSKLATEGLTTGEKMKLAYNIASTGMTVAMGGVGAIAAINDVMTLVQTVNMLHTTMATLNVSVAAWQRSVTDEQQVLTAVPFKAIPGEMVAQAFIDRPESGPAAGSHSRGSIGKMAMGMIF